MSKKRHHGTRQPQKSRKTPYLGRTGPSARNPRWSQFAIIAGVVLLVAVVLILKNQAADPSAATESGVQATSTLPEAVGQTQATATIAEVEGQTQATAVLAQAEGGDQATAPPDELPEAQLERLLTAGKPTVAFFHSNTCAQCVRMNEIVQQVYPDFADTVALVDVNVYDQRNQNLLQRAGIRVIPTLILIDRAQQGQSYAGVMEPDVLREQLQTLAQE